MSRGPVVVAVLSHRDPPQLRRLVARILEGEHTVVLLHHDPRAEPAGIPASDRVFLVESPQPCEWGRMSLALGMTRCFSEAARQIPDLEWLLLISGQDYPAQHLKAIEATLDASDHDAMLRHFKVPAQPFVGEHHWQTRCRERYLHRLRVPGSHRAIPFPRRSIFNSERRHTGLDLYIGDMWVNLRAPAVHHILDQQRGRPEITRYFNRSSVPDEAYVPTLLLNDAERLRVCDERHRYIEWSPGAKHPRTLDSSDLAPILATNDFFARKVDPGASGELLNELDLAASRYEP